MHLLQFGQIHESLLAKISIRENYTTYCNVPLFQCLDAIMTLLKYFLVQSKSLPDPNGLLSSTVKPQAIEVPTESYLLLASDSSIKDDGSGSSRGCT